MGGVLTWRLAGEDSDGATPTYSATGGPIDQSSSPLSLPYPVGLAANDIAIIHAIIVDALDANTLNVPSGFTQIDQRPLFSAADTTSSTALFWKRLNGSESGTVSVSAVNGVSSNDTLAAAMSIWRGCLVSGDPYEAVTANRGNSTSLDGSAVTTTGPNRRVVHFGSTYSTATSTPAGGYTEEYDYSAFAGTGEAELILVDKERVSAGTESAATHTLSVSRRWVTVAFALIPT